MPHVYLAPKHIYTDLLGGRNYYAAPNKDNGLVQFIQRVTTAQASKLDPLDPGLAFCAYDRQQVIPDSVYLGDDPLARLSDERRAALEDRLSIQRGALPGGSLDRILTEDLFTLRTHPAGLTLPKPVRIGRRRGFQFRFGEYVHQDAFSSSHPAFEPTLAVRRADYAEARNLPGTIPALERQAWNNGWRTRFERINGVNLSSEEAESRYLEHLREWNGFDLLALFGRLSSNDLDRIVPGEFLDDGFLTPRTTLDESWSCANSETLSCDLNWNQDDTENDADIVSNEVRTTGEGDAVGRCTDALSSDDHWAYGVFYWDDAQGNRDAGPICRKVNSTTLTYYLMDLNFDGSEARVFEVSNDTFTELANTAETYSANVDVKAYIEVDGSAIVTEIDDVQEHSLTDTVITGNTHGGFYLSKSQSGYAAIKEWHAADLGAVAAAPTQRLTTLGVG